MLLDEYARLDATALADLVQRGEVPTDEPADTARAAALLTATSVNAVAELYEDAKPACAGQLQGVPLLMKDAGMHEAGRQVACGSALMKGIAPKEDSALMERFRKLGLVSVGRATSSELTIAATVETRLHGTTHNPWDPHRIPGGSSGGSAAAVAAGVVPVAHGSDGGGSIRMPAACCGVVGMKPSRGAISAAPYRHAIGDLVSEFVLTRSVRDTHLLFESLCKPGFGASPGADRKRQAPLTIGYSDRNLDGSALDPQVEAAVGRTRELLDALGHHLVEATPSLSYAEYLEAVLDVWAVETAIAVDEASLATGRAADEHHLEGLTMAWADRGRRLDHVRLGRALDALNDVHRSMDRFMDSFDAYLTSTLPTLPPELGLYDPAARVDADWYYRSPIGRLEVTTMVFNCSGQPAISLPLETSDSGLPIGIHLAAPYGCDIQMLRLAADLEAARPWAQRIPPIHV